MQPRLCLRSVSTCAGGSFRIPNLSGAEYVGTTRLSASFSTSVSLSKNPLGAKKKVALTGPPKKGGKTLKLSRSIRAKDTRPPAPGERKAIRKRIVLSNTNALEVPGLEELNRENSTDDGIRGRVMALPDELVDSLRAVEAFKVNQGWSFFRKPATLIRQEAFEMSRLMDEIAGKTLDKRPEGSGADDQRGRTTRRIICGERAAGKSVLLLQAMSMAFLKGWVVINIPEARDITIGQTDYSPLPNSSPVQFVQKDYIANLLGQTAKANRAVLSTMRLIHTNNLPMPVPENITLDRFAEIGSSDPDIAWTIFQILWKELTSLPKGESAESSSKPEKNPFRRPPILLALDNVSHIMTTTHYQTVDKKGNLHPIHAHDLSIVKHFVDHLSGETALGNGGLVLAATSESEHAKSDALEVATKMAKARQNTSQPQNLGDFWDPYKSIDHRSLDALRTVDFMNLSGLSRQEARTVMEYWAGSGMLRGTVADEFVVEKWTLAGGGIVGELEKAVVRTRV